MIFPVDPETARWTQKTISRLRGRRDWSSVCTREACWTPAFLSALIDEVDYLLTAGLGKDAYEISRHLGLLVERIRAEECPQNELGKRSLSIWAMAAHGSSCRQSSLFDECERTFADALGRLECGVLPWASADLFRRYAALLAQRCDRSAFYFIEEALAGFVDLPERTAETLTLRGVIRHQIDHDSSSAIDDFTKAAALVDPTHGERSRWNYQVALHNIAYQLVASPGLCFETFKRARQMLQVTRAYFGHGMCPRKLTSLWVEGLLSYRFGWNRHAERLLNKARKGFLKFGCFDYAMTVSLDLALILLEEGEPEQAAEQLGSTAETLPEGLKHLTEYSGFWMTSVDRKSLLQTRFGFNEQLQRSAWRKSKAPRPQIPNPTE